MKPLLLAALLLAPGLPQQRIQTGTIVGQVRNMDGSLAVGVRVAALLVTDGAGQGGASMYSALAQTNETGRYRLDGVLPGRYHVIAGLIDFPTYFPGVKAIAESRIVTVAVGSTVPGIDFALARPAGVRVSGKVAGIPSGLPPGVFRVTLLPSGTPAGTTGDALVQPDGSFDFLRVAPGRYALRLLPAFPGQTASALNTLSVDDKNIVGLELAAPPLVLGRVTVQGGGRLPVQAAAVAAGVADPPTWVRLQTRPWDVGARSTSFTATVRADGLFILPIAAEDVRLIVSTAPIGFFVKSISYGVDDLLQSPLRAAGESRPEIQVVLTQTPPDTAAMGVTVSGRVTGLPDGPPIQRWLLMQAVASAATTEVRVGEAPLRPDGTFSISNVPSATYTVTVQPNNGFLPQTLGVGVRDMSDVQVNLLSRAQINSITPANLANLPVVSNSVLDLVRQLPPGVAPSLAAIPLPAGLINESALSTRLRQGSSMGAPEADAIEKRLETQPDNLEDRVQLLGFYFLKQSDAVAASKRRNHVLWVIENYPAIRVAGQPEAQLRRNDPALPMARDLWLKQVAKRPDDPAIILNAGKYFINVEPSLSEQMFLKGQSLQPADAVWPSELGQLYLLKARFESSSDLPMTGPQGARKALEALEKAFELSHRPALLPSMAEAAYRADATAKATRYATEAIATGSADSVHDGNHMLGQMAFEKGDIAVAKNYLLASGKVSGSPVLGSFGPRMILANDLLKKGERAAVQAYLEECLAFWTSGQDKLNGWIDSLKRGTVPDITNSGR